MRIYDIVPPKKKIKQSKLLSILLVILLFVQILGGILFYPPPEEAHANSASWYNSSWLYRKPITIDNTGNANDLTNYQVKITLSSSNFDFTKAQSNGEDLRFTNSDGTTVIDYWIESYNNSGQTAIIWVEVPSISASSSKTIYMYYGNSDAGPYNFFRLSVDSTIHNDYGLAYPVTYKFSIPSGSSNLRAYRRYSTSGSWSRITEKTSSDFFNGIEAVRFDYTNNKAYISVAFDDSSDEIHLKITNASDEIVDTTYLTIPEYYDNREMAVTSTWDDWSGDQDVADPRNTCSGCNDSNTQFTNLTNILSANNIGHTVGVVTADFTWSERYVEGPPNWTSIQNVIDNSDGYLEIAAHSRHHPNGVPYDDYEDEIDGSKQDVITNLSLPYSKGDTEYVYTYIAPAYTIDNDIRSQAGTSKYLVIRGGGWDEDDWATWNSTYNLWNATGYTTKSDCDIDCNCPNPSYDDLTALNNAFDQAYTDNSIYHWHGHPGSNWGTSYTDFDDPNSIFNQHVNYIADKTYAWYAGIGYLYLYHYVKEKSVVSVSKIGGSDGNSVFEFFDNFDDETTGANPSKWDLTEPTDTDIDIDDQVYYGSTGKSARLYDNSSSDYPEATKTFSALSKLVLEFRVRTENSDSKLALLGRDDDTEVVYIAFRDDGYIKYCKRSGRFS